MKALVTGGAGFIGSHLCFALSDLGWDITILDNFSSGLRQNIEQLLTEKPETAHLCEGSLTDPHNARKSIDNVDVVFHFASNPEIRLELCEPSTSFQQNVYATHLLLEEMKKSEAKTIVFASTSTVYGDAKKIPTPENYSPLEPISIYGASKLASEALVMAYAHTYNKSAIILRLANIVGPRSRHGVIHDFISKIKGNPHELEILGDGTQRKSYLYVDDCIEATFVSMKKSKRRVEVFNVGSEDQVNVRTIASVVAEEMNIKDIKFRFTGGVEGGRGWIGDVKNMFLDIGKLRELGWKPRLNSEDAVRRATQDLLRQDL